MSIVVILLAAAMLYAVIVATFIILDNRSPQSTLAWLGVLLLAPMVGLPLYFLFGRNRRVFSRRRELLHQDLRDTPGGAEMADLDAAGMLARLEAESRTIYARKLVQLARANSNSVLTVHNRLEVLQDAVEAYPRLLNDLARARSSIHFESYSWAADAFTTGLQVLLAEKVRNGVEVRVLFDPVGSFSALTSKYVREMRALGVRMEPFSRLYRLHTVGYRNHRKIAIIDGEIGYLGGMNIGQEHLVGGEGFPGWRDTQLRIAGEAAGSLEEVFAVDWHNATGEDTTRARHAPTGNDASGSRVPVQITTSGPDSEWRAIRQLYFLMILSAQRHVYMQSPFFIVDASVAEALKTAALAGVDVRIMLAPRGGRYQVPYWAANTYAREMVAAGIRVYFYRGAYFHPKTINIDSEICSIGSANMDIRSFSINYEINALVYDAATAHDLAQDFLTDLEKSVEFDADEYEARSVLLHLRDSLARLLSPLL